MFADLKKLNAEDLPGKIKQMSILLFKKADLEKTNTLLDTHESLLKDLDHRLSELMSMQMSVGTGGNSGDNSGTSVL